MPITKQKLFHQGTTKYKSKQNVYNLVGISKLSGNVISFAVGEDDKVVVLKEEQTFCLSDLSSC